MLGTSCEQCRTFHEVALHQRHALRDFLRYLGPEEGDAVFRVVRPDQSLVGEATRARLSAAIDSLYLRYRQIVRLHIEHGLNRAEIAVRFHISLKTFERDYQGALDSLWQVVVGERG